MAKPVELDDLVSEVCAVSSEMVVLLNRQTGEVAGFSWDWELEPEDRAQYESEDWEEVPFPDADADWRVMRDFALDQDDEAVRDLLWDELNRSHPFRRFRQGIERLGLREAWYPYYEQGMERLVRVWLEVEGIPFTQGATAS